MLISTAHLYTMSLSIIPGVTPRAERFQNFQALVKEMKETPNPNTNLFLTRLYNGLTSEIAKAEAEITRQRSVNQTLTEELQSLRGGQLEVCYNRCTKLNSILTFRQRPATAESTTTVGLMRSGLDAQREMEGTMIPVGVNFQQLQMITVDHARAMLMARRTEITTELECWVCGNEPAHDNGYKAINLLNTNSQAEGQANVKIGVKKMYLHHLSLIADGRIDELGWCTQAEKRFQVSHLCHNAGCANPRHLQVEESQLNKDRNSCQRHEIIEYSGVGPMRYNPCRHGGERSVFRKCILPTRVITEPGNYGNDN